MTEYSTPDEVDTKLKKVICQSCFPPKTEEVADFHLDYTYLYTFYIMLMSQNAYCTTPSGYRRILCSINRKDERSVF